MRALWLTQAARWQICLVLAWMLPSQHLFAQSPVPRIISIEPASGAEVHRRGTEPLRWDLATTDTNNNHNALYPGDRLRVTDKGRAAVLWTDNTVYRLERGSELEVPEASEQGLVARLRKGLAYFFHRDKPGTVRVETSKVSLTVRGTEFTVEVLADGTTKVGVIDGQLLMSNAVTTLRLPKGQSATAQVDGTLQPSAAINATNLVQWCLYYPGIVYLGDLRLSPQEEQVLSNSLIAYRAGDLQGALAQYPPGRPPGSADERLFLAALWLSIGQVEECVSRLAQMPNRGESNERIERVGGALRQLIAAVKHERRERVVAPTLPSEWLAESYYQQSRAGDTYQETMKDWEEEYYGKRFYKDQALRNALKAAQLACRIAPDWDFAWVRRAELQFGFGDTKAARKSLDKVMWPSLLNAHAFVLDGFLAAAQDRWKEAEERFNQAIGLDGGLANGWLGRGLTRFRQGRVDEGRKDLEIAAAMEPLRSLPRSYLGKGYYEEAFSAANPYATVKDLFGGKQRQRDLVAHATNELALAQQLDTKDPTPLFYSALINQHENRVNESVDDLEKSIQLNDNRAVYRSQLLLDQDRAVRSANLASIYRDAGMTDVSVREAARAVTYDYANDSAHLFLSDSYNELRDPTRFNLRYETVWFSELLLANLLSPVGAGRLSQNVSQQEYSRLFQADGLGLSSSTLVRSDNKSVTELASQFGTFGGTSYALDLDYQHNGGVRPNNDLDDIEWYTTLKQQITPQDTALALIKYEDYHSGDNFQYYDPQSQLRTHYRFDEYQHPIAVAGWDHEWSPEVHTLFLGGRLENEQFFSDLQATQLVLIPTTTYSVDSVPFDVQYHSTFEIYTAELNQIFQWDRLSLSAGARYQNGTFDTAAQLYNPGKLQLFFDGTPTNTASSDGFERITGYGYLTAEPLDRLWLTAGLVYDDITYPQNFRNPPISSGEDHSSQLGPKAAIVWEPVPQATVRGIFTRSLGGISLDESYRLEPTQLAGFPQTFRSLISESVVGSVSAPKYQTFGLALDLKFPSRTYAGIQVERLETDVRRSIGVFVPTNVSGQSFKRPFIPSSTLEQLDYRENSFSASLNQLLGDNFVLGASYKLTDVELHGVLPQVPLSATPIADQRSAPDLHQASGYILFNHPSGLFARAETDWYHQSSSTLFYYNTQVPGDDFFQENLFVGYRFAHRRVELLLGILNLSDQDYHLNPLTVYAELPRKRSFIARLKFEF
jgi:hypothetical protein